MSSHREAPEISKDPVADGTDVYAFVSPDRPDTVTLIANFIPLQKPDGGPNFYEFGDDVLYEIHVANRGTATPDVTYQFRFHDQGPEQEDVPLQHRADHDIADADLEPAAVLQRDPDPERQAEGTGQQPALPAGQCGQAQHAQLRRAGRAGGALDRRPARCSPDSGPTRSTSTSAASSTSARCGRSTRRT